MTDEQEQNSSYRRRPRYFYGRIYPGIWLIVIGLIFLANNFGYFDGRAWGKLWPLFLIVPGVFMLLRPRRDQ
jgi:hypothetical protein